MDVRYYADGRYRREDKKHKKEDLVRSQDHGESMPQEEKEWMRNKEMGEFWMKTYVELSKCRKESRRDKESNRKAQKLNTKIEMCIQEDASPE